MSKVNIDEIELDKEENNAQLRLCEKDLLKGLLTAAAYKTGEESIRRIDIVRNSVVLISFRVRPLSEEDYENCREKHTKYVRNKQLGIKMPEDTDNVRYRSALIYLATVDEDKAAVWDNKEAWKALNLVTGTDLIDAVLLAGEKDAAIDIIEKISGYTGATEEVAKN